MPCTNQAAPTKKKRKPGNIGRKPSLCEKLKTPRQSHMVVQRNAGIGTTLKINNSDEMNKSYSYTQDDVR
jgi:hypothetical protein